MGVWAARRVTFATLPTRASAGAVTPWEHALTEAVTKEGGDRLLDRTLHHTVDDCVETVSLSLGYRAHSAPTVQAGCAALMRGVCGHCRIRRSLCALPRSPGVHVDGWNVIVPRRGLPMRMSFTNCWCCVSGAGLSGTSRGWRGGRGKRRVRYFAGTQTCAEACLGRRLR